MENASKALIMAAEVLVGVMIISIGVYLFNLFANYSKEASYKMEEAQIAQFNNQFLKYYGERIVEDENGNEISEPVKCTIHEIVSLANLAKKNNILYELENQDKYSANTLYIQIDIKSSKKTLMNIEKYDEQKIIDLIKNNDLVTSTDENQNKITQTKYYKCSEYKISEDTKRVMYMKFVEI